MFRLSLFWMFVLILAIPETVYLQKTGAGRSPQESTALFSDIIPLKLSLTASIKSLKGDTNDSTYLEGTLRFIGRGQVPDSVNLRLQARGDFRRSQCYFTPLKFTFEISEIERTLFAGNEELKLVLPCLIGARSDDYVLKEYLAYKLFEQVSPYYYKTRLTNFEFIELKGKRERTHQLIGFLIEDHSTLAKRLDGKRIRRNLPPQMQDPRARAILNLFQFAIGNTDFSVKLQHNLRLFYIEGKYVSIPYDFDMAGLVNAPYATVSNTQNLEVQISMVTDRAFKGYSQEAALMEAVRQQFLDARPGMMRQLEILESLFEDHRQYAEASAYLDGFFKILDDDRKFEREILRRMRE